jgi:hypothetical protein
MEGSFGSHHLGLKSFGWHGIGYEIHLKFHGFSSHA